MVRDSESTVVAPWGIDSERLRNGCSAIRALLLQARNAEGWWTGELSTSPLSTATAVMALEQVVLQRPDREAELKPLIDGGLQWLAQHQNEDGGWGDTLKSYSNISTTMLAHAVFHATNTVEANASVVERAKRYIDRLGGVPAVIARYGKDKTFSVPILTHCALAGLVDWKEVPQLPFQLACLPHQFYATIRLPVVSYALPALIAIGQVRHHFLRSRNPTGNWLRDCSIEKSLQVLGRIQPTTGGYLEATPLTSFVTMSLAAKGLADHAVVENGIRFIKESVLEDGSWPIDTNLATWVTTLSVNALQEAIPEEERPAILNWLLEQQYRDVHPFTNAAPGGWAWTDLSGGVPDADDTPGAMLALLNLCNPNEARIQEALTNASQWLINLQNRDGGWPTFCRGWGTLPFDRSSPDITAHCIRALLATEKFVNLKTEIQRAVGQGFRFLDKQQQADGSWIPLWFGNQDAPDEINPLYGTAKVLLAYGESNQCGTKQYATGIKWLQQAQNPDGGWGGYPGSQSTVEETSLALEALLSDDSDDDVSTEITNGLNWLLDRVESGTIAETAPIGFYFAKLWYFERLYPLIFAASTLHRAFRACNRPQQTED